MKKLKYLGWLNFLLFWILLYFWVSYPSTLTLCIMMIPVAITFVLGLLMTREINPNFNWKKDLRRRKLKRLNNEISLYK